ncbi:unnamed protein product [Ostreobium quekettii]|uniref:Uncharacterized protein n=1 Tax=Ostreobium quekettii TaxID=121088 RepID=A0A8S1IPR7_9CHLO|nr:unnamed protein product [Ostreobium quekettii]|eukprot:evm.model.scf_253EXC.7 EVM.evm.TU.scf_253EXC.7   scf_253EXC:48774-53258(-)
MAMGTQGLLLCVICTLILSLPDAGGAEFVPKPQKTVYPQLQMRTIKSPHRFSKGLSTMQVPTMRKMLQSDLPLCEWSDEECEPRIELNTPDPQASQFFNTIEMCANITLREDCLGVPECFWVGADGTCSVDFVAGIRDCLVPEYAVLIRAGQCPRVHREIDCNSLPGCSWNAVDGKCEVDFEPVQEAFDSNGQLSQAYGIHIQCLDSNACGIPCTSLGQDRCGYLPFVDVSQWFSARATSALCRYMEENFRCEYTLTEAACDGECEIDEDGECSQTHIAAIDILYESSEARKAEMLGALDSCPIIDDPEACNAFTGTP